MIIRTDQIKETNDQLENKDKIFQKEIEKWYRSSKEMEKAYLIVFNGDL